MAASVPQLDAVRKNMIYIKLSTLCSFQMSSGRHCGLSFST